MKKLALNQQFIKFLLVGFFATTINYGIFYVLYKFTIAGYMISSSIGFMIGVLFGYIFNKIWTFSINNRANYLGKYFLVYFISLLFLLALLSFLVEFCHIHPEIANILAIAMSTILSFFGVKLFVFNKP